MQGKIKWFNSTVGYGFVTPEVGDKDIFLHKTALPEGMQLQTGDSIEFEVAKNDRGVHAVDIKLIEEG